MKVARIEAPVYIGGAPYGVRWGATSLCTRSRGQVRLAIQCVREAKQRLVTVGS